MKKPIIHLILWINLVIPTQILMSADPADQRPNQPGITEVFAEQLGRGMSRGVVGGVGQGTGEVSKKLVKEVFGAVRDEAPELGKSAGGVFRGAGEAFKEGGDVDVFAKELGGAARRNTKQVTDELGAGMKEAFKAGGEFDQGMGEVLGTSAKNINQFVQSTIHNNAMKMSAIGISSAALFFGVKYGIPMYFRMLERMLTRPKLIIASSKKTFKQQIADLFTAPPKPTPMVFAPALESRLDSIVKATRNINKKINEGKTNIKYRNMMLYGPPGTGKTMFAKELAQRSGMEYAFMSGSSFAKFKEGEGIEALDELFAWANKSRGLMIFIDEAETFLAKREHMDPNSYAYKLLNNFLNYTGERSPKFMLVFATNHKNTLDSAMYRRIDDLIEMPLPGRPERIRLLTLYRDKVLMDEAQNGKDFVESVRNFLDRKTIEKIADQTKGLSGGDLEGVINTIKTDADILDPALVSPAVIELVVERAMQKHKDFTQGKELGYTPD